jgi:DNA-directed RNA polymerase subunit M/transcription elongation factor TFIIS
MTMDLAAITHCPACGSTDLGFFGMTEERTDDDITDIVECADCKWTVSAPDAG